MRTPPCYQPVKTLIAKVMGYHLRSDHIAKIPYKISGKWIGAVFCRDAHIPLLFPGAVLGLSFPLS